MNRWNLCHSTKCLWALWIVSQIIYIIRQPPSVLIYYVFSHSIPVSLQTKALPTTNETKISLTSIYFGFVNLLISNRTCHSYPLTDLHTKLTLATGEKESSLLTANGDISGFLCCSQNAIFENLLTAINFYICIQEWFFCFISPKVSAPPPTRRHQINNLASQNQSAATVRNSLPVR